MTAMKKETSAGALVRSASTEEKVRALREQRESEARKKTAELLHIIAFSMGQMATALDEDDEILGVLAGRGIADNLPLLPKHVRDVFMENLTDDAAAGARAERLYYEYIDAAYAEATSATGDCFRAVGTP